MECIAAQTLKKKDISTKFTTPRRTQLLMIASGVGGIVVGVVIVFTYKLNDKHLNCAFY